MAAPPSQWADALAGELGADGRAYLDREMFLSSLPPGYVEETVPGDAAVDWLAMSGFLPEQPTDALHGGDGDAVGPVLAPGGPASDEDPLHPIGSLVLRPSRGSAPGDFRLRRAGRHRVELSSLLPVLESFGLAAVEAVPWHFSLEAGVEAYVDDIGLRVVTTTAGPGFGSLGFSQRLVDAIGAVLAGGSELSTLNRLVVGAGLQWREVNLLCAYRAYRQVVGGARAADRSEAIAEALVSFPAVAVAAVRLFRARLGPDSGRDGDDPAAAGTRREPDIIAPAAPEPEAAAAAVVAALSEVPDLAHYGALRELLALVEATTRSNWALERSTIALKFAGREVPFLAGPRPLVELFVWAPSFEALHLRFGLVARGGIRWSERQSDMRAEVLGLARAQVKKNSLIVPTGAKGAFVLRTEHGRRPSAEGVYRSFMHAMLDVTDNMVDGRAAHPPGVRARDGHDPYLVVAPDKGTARFSDLANAISIERSFWLGDAFASGGSHGYDHKALAITARGAWVAVRRHFRALGMDAQHDEVRVVGVGDMSGDVFGNGMLQSRSVRLVAAFDHRHVFIDPNPDPDRSFAERLRLSQLTGSSWADFDLAAASPGAAVVARYAKQVELSPEACAAVGCGPGPMSPPELIKAVLRAPVDLIFFGGVGTFVKAATESDYEVDDAVNDDVRVNADQLRARVVVEGANLAVTPRARTSYSRRGGRVNTDFIDNAAGVAMSDREVNLKILFGMAGSAGLLGPGGRDEMMKAAEDDAAGAVLDTVDGSLVALDQAALGSAKDLPAFEALLGDLEHSGALDRDAEALPGVEELARRRDAGAGLSRPELAVVLAFARSALARSVESSALVADPALTPCAVRYFPTVVRDRFAHLIPAHPLFAQLLSSELANEVVRRTGAIWAHELGTETGSQLWEVAGAYWSASQVLGAAGLAEAVDGLAWAVGADAENALRAVLTGAVDRLARWYLGQRPRRLPGEVLALDGPMCQVLQGGELLVEVPADIKKLGDLGVPSEVVLAAAQLAALSAVGELGEVARASQRPLADVVPAHGVIDTELSLPSLVRALHEWPALDRWQRWQVHALVADLAAVRVTNASSALVANPGAGGAQAAHLWLEARRPAVSRALWLVRELTGGGRPNLPLAAVAVAALGQLPLAAAVK